MLDRLSVTMPKWKERSPADIGVMLVELLAYEADYLSYHQDAVATEAYLGTARKRISVRRHARLLDYYLHDGCNARTWVTLSVAPEGDGTVLPGALTLKNEAGNTTESVCPTQFLTQVTNQDKVILTTEDFSRRSLRGSSLRSPCTMLCCMPAATKSTSTLGEMTTANCPQGPPLPHSIDDANSSLAQHLCAGDVLILESALSAISRVS